MQHLMSMSRMKLYIPSKIRFSVSFGTTTKNKIKRGSIYQDYDKGGIRMTDLHIMIKALRLAWIPRLLNPDRPYHKCYSESISN